MASATSTRPTNRIWSLELATATLELLEAAPGIDVIFVPVGGGSGLFGARLGAREVNPAIRVVGVQAEGTAVCRLSGRRSAHRHRGQLLRSPKDLQPENPLLSTLALLPCVIDEFVLVSDQGIAAAIRLLFKRPPRLPRVPAPRPLRPR